MMKTVNDPYERFKALLNENSEFPGPYTHKFIGANTPEFRKLVSEFESKFIGLTRTGEKTSASGNHVSFTYEYIAASAEDVVELAIKTKEIPGVLYIL
jgi:putative lipoic acid-binding regulatory protein